MGTDAGTGMTSWLGALARGGVLHERREQAGRAVAAYVVGADRLEDLRRWLAAQPADVAARERRAAIEVCIWMAHADRSIDPEEAHFLRELIGASRLDEDTQDELVGACHEPPSLAGLETRLTHPTLRELLLALCWELAIADRRVDRAERDCYTGLALRLGVDPARAAEIQRAIGERLP